MSLSARRAWIEIIRPVATAPSAVVALRKESVDRNILKTSGPSICQAVALRKESVDRNKLRRGTMADFDSRSPQGERG